MHIARASHSAVFPARVMLVGAMNPCRSAEVLNIIRTGNPHLVMKPEAASPSSRDAIRASQISSPGLPHYESRRPDAQRHHRQRWILPAGGRERGPVHDEEVLGVPALIEGTQDRRARVVSQPCAAQFVNIGARPGHRALADCQSTSRSHLKERGPGVVRHLPFVLAIGQSEPHTLDAPRVFEPVIDLPPLASSGLPDGSVPRRSCGGRRLTPSGTAGSK